MNLLHVYVVVLVFTAGLATVVMMGVLRTRNTPGRTAMMLMLLAGAEWSLCAALEPLAGDIPTKMLWSKLEYLGAQTAAPLGLVFALQYTHQARYLNWRTIASLFVIPVTAILLAATNEAHRLIWTSVTPSAFGGSMIAVYEHGLAFFVSMAFIFLCMFLLTFALVRAVVRLPAKYRPQLAAVAAAGLVMWGGVAVYIFKLSPVPGLDTSPLAFSLTSLILAGAVFGLRLFDLVPVARAVLIERMSDGVLVLDEQGRIVDLNPAVGRILGLGPGAIGTMGGKLTLLELDTPASGAPPPSVSSTLLRVLSAPAPSVVGEEEVREIQIGAEGTPPSAPTRYLDVRATPLRDRSGRGTARLVIVRDITPRRAAEAALREANQRLQAQLAQIEALQEELREQALRDPLTGLYNRRYLDDILSRELARAAREHLSISLVMIDLDHFKKVNDTWGHDTGDLVLRGLARLLLAQTRAADIVCRHGGEEFLVVMPGAPLAIALRRAETWRQALAAVRLVEDEDSIRVTISLGVAAYPTHGSTPADLLRAADRALYAAKAAGRNRVVATE